MSFKKMFSYYLGNRSKEPIIWIGSFEYPKEMLKLIKLETVIIQNF